MEWWRKKSASQIVKDYTIECQKQEKIEVKVWKSLIEAKSSLNEYATGISIMLQLQLS